MLVRHVNLFCGVGLMTMAFAHVAIAQDNASVAPQPQVNSGVGDIVVTATRREESMQRVPIAVTAASGEALAQANITNLQSISQLAPGVQIAPQFKPGDAVFQIRGQVQTDTAPTIDASVGVYFDDVYIARSAGSLINFVDIERVEVLKGPQGTLFGKNTTGGALRVMSKRPTQKFEGYGLVSYESYDRLKLEGVLNIPISNTLAARFAGQYDRKNGGYATNPVTGNKVDTSTSYFGRGSLLWEPNDRLSALFSGDYTRVRAGGLAQFLRYYVPENGPFTALEAASESGLGFDVAAGTAILQGLARAHGTRHPGMDLRDVTSSSYSYDFATGGITAVGGRADPFSRNLTWGTSANISYDFGFGTLKSITAYRKVKTDISYDIDGTRFAILDSFQESRARQFSQELLLSGQALNDRLDWTVGGLYFDEKPFTSDKVAPLAGVSSLSGGGGTITLADAHNESWGAFVQGTYKLTDALSVTAGVRYSEDKRDFDASAFDFTPTGATSCVYSAANGLATLPNFTAPCTISSAAKFNQWSYTGSLNYQIDPSKMVYLRTSRGYRAGGFNPRINAPEVIGSFKPEIVTDYEFGVKAEWLDRALRTNLAVFYSKGTDVQTTVNGISPTNGNAITVVQNIGTRKVKGFEAEVIARPANFLTFNAGLTYLDAQSSNPIAPDVTYVELTPPWSWNIGVSADMNFGSDYSGTARVDMTYRDKMHDGPPLRGAVGTIIYEGYYRDVALINARYTLRHKPTGIQLAIFGRNLTNQLYEARAGNVGGLGFGFGTLAEPRVIGAELKVPFGAR